MTPVSDPQPLPSPRGNESHIQGRSSGSWVRDAQKNERHVCGYRRIGKPEYFSGFASFAGPSRPDERTVTPAIGISHLQRRDREGFSPSSLRLDAV
jgi:hypothetical protein